MGRDPTKSDSAFPLEATMSYSLFGSTFTLPPNVSYRGEGNSSIVVSLPDTREILRLHKKFKPRSLFGWIVTFLKKFFIWNVKHEMDRETQNLRFYVHVMRALLGRQLVGPARQVYLSRRQVKELNECLVNLRPAHRKGKYIQSGRATIFDDYAFLPKHLSLRSTHDTFAVEIKPKQGFIPRLQKKLDKCTYCLNQYLKLQNGQIDRISHYCPFDLFSGVKERMFKAISALVEDPQNNLRIFQNGLLVYGENKPLTVFHEVMESWLEIKANFEELLQRFSELLSAALLKDFPVIESNHLCASLPICGPAEGETSTSCIEVTGENLSKNCVLKRIFTLQQLDLMGPQLYSKTADSSGLDLWKYIDYLLEEINSNKHKCARCAVAELIKRYSADVGGGEKDRSLFFVPYLLACVARDCSIMLSFKRLEEDDLSGGAMSEDVQIITVGSARYVIKVGILDLYPKPMSSILKHCKRADAVCEAYRRVVVQN